MLLGQFSTSEFSRMNLVFFFVFCFFFLKNKRQTSLFFNKEKYCYSNYLKISFIYKIQLKKKMIKKKHLQPPSPGFSRNKRVFFNAYTYFNLHYVTRSFIFQKLQHHQRQIIFFHLCILLLSLLHLYFAIVASLTKLSQIGLPFCNYC